MVDWVYLVDSNILQPQLKNDEKYLISGGYSLIYTIGAYRLSMTYLQQKKCIK
jgi:hypothetical protein